MTETEKQVRRYELAEGVNSVRLGSLVIGPDGIEVDDPRQAELLDEFPAVQHVKPAAPKTKAKAKP